MILLSSIAKNRIVLICRCGLVEIISVADLIEVYGGDVDVDAVGRAARCSRCRTKRITDIQIIYAGSSDYAMRTGGQANSDHSVKCDD